jgi:4,5-dihydroxyphthalate decarboxylase
VSSRIQLSMGISDYDHVRDFASGSIKVEGLELVHIDLPVEEIFYRFLNHREWDVSEVSLAKYSALVASGDTSLVGIPVFPSRSFRHSSMYVRSDSALDHPSQLRGATVGLPEWAQTAAVYSRALLQHEYDVPLTEVSWVQAGVNQAGRKEKVGVSLPPGVECRSVPDRSLTRLLLDGTLDAVFSAHPPTPFEHGDGSIRRLIGNLPVVEDDYFEQTGIFPIMHTVVIRCEVVERYPWVPMSLFKGFELAKRASITRLGDATVSRLPVRGSRLQEAFAPGQDDPWPYGVDANRVTLDAFLAYAHEQGVTGRRLEPDELFAASVDAGFRI